MITFDNSATFSQSGASVFVNLPLTVASDATLLITAICNSPDSAPSVKVNSTYAMNLLANDRYNSLYGISVFYLFNPPTGSVSVHYEKPGGFFGVTNPAIILASYKGTTSLGTSVQDQEIPLSIGTTYTLTPTSKVNDLVLHFSGLYYASNTPTITYATGESLRVQSAVMTNWISVTEKAGAATSTTVSVNFADNGTSYLFDVAVALSNPIITSNANFFPFF